MYMYVNACNDSNIDPECNLVLYLTKAFWEFLNDPRGWIGLPFVR